MKMATFIFVTFLLIISLIGCGNTSYEDTYSSASDISTPQIEYWIHTIESSEVYYISASPYGYYQVNYYDTKLSGDYWYDIWFVADDGSWIRLAPVYDSNISVWYNIIHLFDGSLAFNTGIDMTGETMVIFRAESEYIQSMGLKYMSEFNAQDYFKIWPPDIK